MTITLLDSFPVGDVSIGPGNVVTTTGAGGNSAIDGFAIQIAGTHSTLSFATNLTLENSVQSVALSVAVDETNVPADLELVSVDFDVDGDADGISMGTLMGIATTVSGTGGQANGGTTLNQAWALADCTDDVPGIGSPWVYPEAAAIDWHPGKAGYVTISFAAYVTDPILLFSFTDDVVETFDFDDRFVLTLFDSFPVGDVSIEPGNVVTTTGMGLNRAIDGFAVQISGTHSAISFATNVNLDGTIQSVAVSVAAEETNIPAQLDLVSIDFEADTSDDGLTMGTLDGFAATVSGTDGMANGGITLAQAWVQANGTDGVPGIGGPKVVSEAAAIDWNPGAMGFTTLSFAEHVVDPILLFAFTDNVVQTFDFGDALMMTLLDQHPLGDVSIEPGNIVTTTGAGTNSAIDGFAIQIMGTHSAISFATNLTLENSIHSVAVSAATNVFDRAFFADGFESGDTSKWSSAVGGI